MTVAETRPILCLGTHVDSYVTNQTNRIMFCLKLPVDNFDFVIEGDGDCGKVNCRSNSTGKSRTTKSTFASYRRRAGYKRYCQQVQCNTLHIQR
jgi:hypothetical protein